LGIRLTSHFYITIMKGGVHVEHERADDENVLVDPGFTINGLGEIIQCRCESYVGWGMVMLGVKFGFCWQRVGGKSPLKGDSTGLQG
jgi:hypothetical protein